LDPRLNEPSAKKILKSLNIRPKKSLGQSFLQELSLLKEPLQFLELGPGVNVLEIGAGIGNATLKILDHGARVTALEVDNRFAPILSLIQKSYPNVRFLFQDAKAVSWDDIFQGESYSVFGNIPYYITGPILEKVLLGEKNWKKAVLLLQEEVSERLLAPPGLKSYSSLTIMANFKARLSRGPKVSKSCFFPAPKVDSIFIYMERKQTPDFPVLNESFFLKLVRGAFQERRKTLQNNLLRMFPSLSKETLSSIEETTGLTFSKRSESLSLKDFCLLANTLLGYLNE